MKKLYFFIFLLSIFTLKAQILTIPDVNFKTKLLGANNTTSKIAKNQSGTWTNVDTNYDGQIQLSEAQNLSYLDLTTPTQGTTYISDITGIENFTNLTYLDLTKNYLTTITLSLPILDYLNVNQNNVSSLNIQNCSLLKTFQISYHGFSTLNVQSNSIKHLNVGGNNTTFNMSVQNLPNLETLTMFFTPVPSLDLSNKPFLNKIRLEDLHELTNLNVQGCNALFEVQLKDLYLLTSLNFQNLPTLNKVSCYDNSYLQSLNLTNSTNITNLYLSDNNLSVLDISTLPNLTDLNIDDNQLTSLNLSNHLLLQNVTCISNNINNLNIQNTPALKNLNCEWNNLQSLVFQPSTLLTTVNAGHNYLTSINVSMLQNLTYLSLQNNQLTSLDVTHNPLLISLGCNSNYPMQTLFVKNGALQANSCNFNDNDVLKYICCDASQINDFNAAAIYNAGYFPVVVNDYCSFTPGGSVYTIQGNTKFDSNNNGCDVNDINRAQQKFSITNGTVSGSLIANNSGNHSIAVGAGSHTISPILENPTYFTISPTSVTANFPTQTTPLNQNFCLTANGTHNDLEVVIIPITAAAPGFNAKYKIIYKNKGTAAQGGTVVFNFNDNLMNFLSSTISPNSQSTGILSWNFTNLLPFETREITATFTLNTPMQTPPLNGGQVLNYTAQINGLNDETPLDNTFILNQTVVNSFDPNDKTCLEGATITQAKVGDYVHYLIRFENTGTANAQNIVVKDMIDTTKFDLATLIPLHASHSFVTRITNPNTVEFIFENIQLPFADATNDGYVSFKIKTKSTLTLGQSFNNTANIYFDYNFPIVTNTYTTTVQNVLATSEVNNNDQTSFSIYPNPVNNILSVKTETKIIKAEIYDATGRIVNSIGVKNNAIDVSSLPKGNYIVKFYTDDKAVTQKFIKN
ncbi:T9SS type A sorting domain-containing protein [Chryseobacterium chendengshani]|uniref:DUF7619 domain-containing protein n=1 Tax=Chryseobacterium sp. LJ668 TaxID=2864040 RepID=UPI001C68CD83|nr:T9SS type A sorting domain-containing protein [Chryseobacterium sp. LJ668]MBW8524047.1 T9SS type A sorting domain-containing protein [Chryseobacterium sp. LJ668]QYK16983.1 T9SS type A sorting domain-containing protein [Chryseobacterium sp. LJ668]